VDSQEMALFRQNFPMGKKLMKNKNMVLSLILGFAMSIAVNSAHAQEFKMEFRDNSGPVVTQNNEKPVFSKFEKQRNLILELFACVDQYEAVFREMKYLNVLGKLPELKIKFQQAEKLFRRNEAKMNEELKILGSLYFAKYQILSGLGDILKDMRIDSGYRAALVRSGSAVLNNYNNLIDRLKVSKGLTENELGEFKLQMANITRRNQKYSITSKYLQLAGEKIPGGEKIIVLEIKDKKALVLYMGPTPSNQQIEDWISLRDLEKRSTWTRSNADFYRE